MAKNDRDVSTAGGKPTKAINSFMYLNLEPAAPEKPSSFYRQILHPRPFLRNTVHHVGSATRKINAGSLVFRVLSQNLVELDAGLREFSGIIKAKSLFKIHLGTINRITSGGSPSKIS